MKLISLSELFRNTHFQTPDYQRGFAWQERQVSDFWNDLQEIGTANQQHFTGTIILEVDRGAQDTHDKPRQAVVVDGQQRLTSSVLLAAAVADALDAKDGKAEAGALRAEILGSALEPKFRYSPSNDSWPFLALNVLKDSAYVAQAADFTNAYTQNLGKALELFGTWTQGLPRDELIAVKDKLTRRVLFNVVEVNPATFNIHVAFESINHRGRQLTTLELLKNRLIYITAHIAGKASDPGASERMRASVNQTWSDVFNWLGRHGKTALDEDRFLRTHSLVYFPGDSSEEEWLPNLLFKQVFTTSRALDGTLTERALTLYLNSLRLGAMLWSYIRRPRNLPPSHVLWLGRISRVNRPLFEPLLLAMYMKALEGRENLAADLHKLDAVAPQFPQLLQQVERFNVLVFLVTGRRGHTATKRMYKLANKLYRKDEPITELLAHATRYVRASITNYGTEDEEGNWSFEDPEFQWYGWFDLEQFETGIRGLLRKGGGGYYEHAFTKVLLFEYEDHLRRKHRADAKVQWGAVGSETIEHVYPQDDTHWRDFTLSLGRSADVINSYRHSLGNLVLLSRGKNAQLQNKPYRDKRIRFREGSFSENELAQKFTRWSPRAVRLRGALLLKFAEQRWDFSLKYWEVKPKSVLTLDG